MKLFKFILGAYIVFMIVMFARCEKVTEIDELVKNTVRVQVILYSDAGQSYTEYTEKSDIRKFDEYISDKDSPVYKCKFDGRIVFFISDDIASGNKNSVAMDFSLQNGCTFIAYPYAGGLQTKELTDEGIAFFSSLKN